MNELFTIPESKSPRLKWMEAHGIEVNDDPITTGYMAFGTAEGSGFGNTAEEAVLAYAKNIGLPLWNELLFG